MEITYRISQRIHAIILYLFTDVDLFTAAYSVPLICVCQPFLDQHNAPTDRQTHECNCVTRMRVCTAPCIKTKQVGRATVCETRLAVIV